MREQGLGSRALLAPHLIQNTLLLGSVREAFLPVAHAMHKAYQRGDVDRALLYALLGYDLALPHAATNLEAVFRKLDAGWRVRLALHATADVDAEYRGFLRHRLSVEKSEKLKRQYGELHLDGRHGVTQNFTRAKAIFESCRPAEVAAFLG